MGRCIDKPGRRSSQLATQTVSFKYIYRFLALRSTGRTWDGLDSVDVGLHSLGVLGNGGVESSPVGGAQRGDGARQSSGLVGLQSGVEILVHVAVDGADFGQGTAAVA